MITPSHSDPHQALLPHLAFAAEGPVAKLANPADKSAMALVIAAITPCVGAPLYEELQSRAFLLQVPSLVIAPMRIGIAHALGGGAAVCLCMHLHMRMHISAHAHAQVHAHAGDDGSAAAAGSPHGEWPPLRRAAPAGAT